MVLLSCHPGAQALSPTKQGSRLTFPQVEVVLPTFSPSHFFFFFLHAINHGLVLIDQS